MTRDAGGPVAAGAEHNEEAMTSDTPTAFALRGTIVDCGPAAGPRVGDEALRVTEDGALIIDNGRIVARGPAGEILREDSAHLPVHDYRDCLLIPGLIDSHIHYPQTDIIASYGEHLLAWLERYTFPAEAAFADADLARETADFFLAELFRNGTTTAMVMGTSHARSADIIFEAARREGMRLVAGKVMMDRNCPEAIQDTAESGYRESRELLERWHGVDRLAYAITPRFAPTSSEAQLEATARLAREFPDAYVHTHLAENRKEVAWVGELFPEARSYLDVYDRYGLVRERSMYAHCIYLDDTDRRRMAEAGAAVAFSPTSNTFLGSGLLDYRATREAGIRTGLATDVGGGCSFSMLRTASEAYKVSCLNDTPLSATSLLHLATRGSAEAMDIGDRVGHLDPGMEADVVVLDPAATPLTARRSARATLEETLFALFFLGDDRHVAATFVGGRNAHPERGPAP
ncbi:guanine deaminase [Aquisalimonas lutea]|uniref:guanine deaminase n=1 Tax=Aquisalimonas lutea TaxID=1327750 RepID=UPI0025B3879B|nr:guanine deaminase [Aquisalimonas lutea]MDN3518133.1 guanine deaminase [Aquisalimonas lutea]